MKGEREMEKVKYYYGREPQTGHPKVTVCLIAGEEPGAFYRGIAICSDSEKAINKKKGKNMALGRAKRAQIKGESNMYIMREEAREMIERCNVPGWLFKSEALANLTEFEERLFNRPE